jgi:DNA-binding IclR family transcriptional regulator
MEAHMDTTSIRAFRVLERLARSDSPRGVTELAQEFGLPKSNLHRVLSTLAELGYAVRTESGYSATLRMWEVGVSVLNRINVQRAAAPYMEELAIHAGETVHLAIRDGSAAVYVAICESTRAARTETRTGERVPLHATAVGKIFQAWSPPTADDVLLRRYTDDTLVDPRQLARELETVRRQGYALNRGEFLADIAGIAAPVTSFNGTVVAALALSGPRERFRPPAIQKYVALVRGVARRISGEVASSGFSF